jgi:CelD/BcsL family acetyltransferase involved in cellulose biosynthesis
MLRAGFIARRSGTRESGLVSTGVTTEPVEAIAGEWRDLAERSGNVFVTPEWYLAWQRHYGAGTAPALLTARHPDGRLRGVAPLVRETSGRLRRVRFAGANVGDEFEPVAAPGEGSEVASALAVELASQPGWSMIVLDNVDASADWPRRLLGALGDIRVRSYRRNVLPQIDLRGVQGWDGYLAGRSRNFRSQVRRYERALSRAHDVRFRRTEESAGLQADLRTFFRLHDARWRARGGSSSAGERVRAFHLDFATRIFERGWLRLWLLELDGDAVAAWYGWHLGGRYAYYLAGFDPRWATSRVGLVLLAHTVRSAIAEGADEYDMLLGDEPYKARFTDSRREVVTLLATRSRDPAGALAAAEVGAWRLSRRLTPEWRRQLRRALRRVAVRLPGARIR